MSSSNLESRIQNLLLSMVQKRIVPLLAVKDPLIRVDLQSLEFYNNIAMQFYPIKNPRYDEESPEDKLNSTIADLEVLEEVFLQAVEQNWDTLNLCESIRSKIKTLDLRHHVELFWNKEKDSIRESLYSQSQWSSSYFDNLKWRLDVQVLTKSGDEVNDTIALFELRTKETASSTTRQNIKFEMDRSEIDALLNSLREIERQINS